MFKSFQQNHQRHLDHNAQFKPELKETATYRNNSTRLTEGGGDNKTQHSGGNGNERRKDRMAFGLQRI